MDNIQKRISVVEYIIINYFHTNDIWESSCLAQSYILYKVIHNSLFQHTIRLLLVKGYIINHIDKVYYGHFLGRAQ